MYTSICPISGWSKPSNPRLLTRLSESLDSRRQIFQACQHTCQHDIAVRRGLGGRKRRSADGAEGDIAAISPAGAPLWSRCDAASVTALQCRGPIYSTWATWAEIGPHFFLFSKGRKSTTLALIRLCVELGLKRKILTEPCATR